MSNIENLSLLLRKEIENLFQIFFIYKSNQTNPIKVLQ